MKAIAWLCDRPGQPEIYRTELAAKAHASAFAPDKSEVYPLVDGRAFEILRAAIVLIADTSPMHAKQDPQRLVLLARSAITRAARGEL